MRNMFQSRSRTKWVLDFTQPMFKVNFTFWKQQKTAYSRLEALIAASIIEIKCLSTYLMVKPQKIKIFNFWIIKASRSETNISWINLIKLYNLIE